MTAKRWSTWLAMQADGGRRHRARNVRLILYVLMMAITPLTVQAATIHVSPGGCTLHDAIRAANANAARGDCSAGSGADTIILPDGHNVVVGATAIAAITSPMTIRTATPGGLAALTDDDHRVLAINGAGNVTLENLSISGGPFQYERDTGRGIEITDSSVSLLRVSIHNNNIDGSASVYGAGIRAINSQLNIEEGDFYLNRAESENVLVASRGGNLYLSDSTATINNSSFRGFLFKDAGFVYLTSNGAGEGAGIYADNSDLTISNSIFESHLLNQNDRHDGVDIYLAANSTADISNSTFFHDFTDSGSRAHVRDSSLHLNNVTMSADVTEYGIVSVNGLVFVSNSIFTAHGYVGFCRAENSSGAVVPFVLQQNVANLLPVDDSCGSGLGFSDRSELEQPADNGGPTRTMRLIPRPTNLAINGGNNASCETHDQRGVSRGVDCDIGAYELDDTADLAVSMDLATPAPYYWGQIIEYQVLVQNLGPSDVHDVDLSFNMTGISVHHYLTGQSCAGTDCSIASIGNGGSVLIRLFVQKDGSASFDAEAIVEGMTGYSSDPILANNIDDSGNGGTLSQAADLSVTQTLLTPLPFAVSDNLTYSIVIENHGPSTATNVLLTNPLSGMSPVSYSGCSSSTPTQCSIAAIGNGGSLAITFVAQATAVEVQNTALVSADPFDPVSSNNDATNKNSAAADANLKLGMELITSPPYYPDQFLQFAVNIVNNGPDPATQVTLDSFTSSNLVITAASTPCDSLPCVIAAPMASGAEVSFILGGDAFSPGALFHRVVVSSNQNDVDTGDNEVIIESTVQPAADLALQLASPGMGPFTVGDVLEYAITVRNNGSISASSALVQPSLTNLELVYVNSTSCPDLPCTIPTVEIGVANQEVIQVRALITGPGSVHFGADVDANEYDDVSVNNSVSANATAVAAPLPDSVFRDGFE